MPSPGNQGGPGRPGHPYRPSGGSGADRGADYPRRSGTEPGPSGLLCPTGGAERTGICPRHPGQPWGCAWILQRLFFPPAAAQLLHPGGNPTALSGFQREFRRPCTGRRVCVWNRKSKSSRKSLSAEDRREKMEILIISGISRGRPCLKPKDTTLTCIFPASRLPPNRRSSSPRRRAVEYWVESIMTPSRRSGDPRPV